jgi:hypothetical protein
LINRLSCFRKCFRKCFVSGNEFKLNHFNKNLLSCLDWVQLIGSLCGLIVLALLTLLFIGYLLAATCRYLRSLRCICPVLYCLHRDEVALVKSTRGPAAASPYPTIIREKKMAARRKVCTCYLFSYYEIPLSTALRFISYFTHQTGYRCFYRCFLLYLPFFTVYRYFIDTILFYFGTV